MMNVNKKTDKKAAPVVMETEFALGKENYKLLAIGFGLIILGLLLMIGTEDIFSFRKITLSVIVMMAGFVFNIYAIMKKPKE
jgi:hypothetical protein